MTDEIKEGIGPKRIEAILVGCPHCKKAVMEEYRTKASMITMACYYCGRKLSYSIDDCEENNE